MADGLNLGLAKTVMVLASVSFLRALCARGYVQNA